MRAAAEACQTREREPASGRGLSGRPALCLLASLIVSLLAASAAPTPLYATYQEQWHFSPITTTIVFGVYAVTVLVALLILGRLSDHLGRKPVLLTALAVQAVSLLVFTTASGVPGLLLARVVQGISTGAALGAIGAGMLDIDRERGTFANAVSPGLGTGTGALVSALFIRYLPFPGHLIYLVILAVILLQAAGVAATRETVTPASGIRGPGTRMHAAIASLRPDVRLPRHVRGPVLAVAPVLFAVWALAGLYGALGPALVRALTGSPDVVLGGLSLTVLTAGAVAGIIALRDAGTGRVMRAGTGALVVGVAVTMLALTVRSAPVFFTGTAISGIGFGSGFQGGIRTVVPRAAAHERAGVLSLLFVISYLGMGVPAVAAGFLAVHGAGITGAALCYSAALIVLGMTAAVAIGRSDK